MRLEEKRAIITGGAGDIAKAAAKKFVDEGAKVMLVDIDEDALKKAVDEIDRDKVTYAVADVSMPQDVINYVKKAKEELGKIDIFLNNAGIEGEVAPIKDYPIDIFQKVMDVNVKGVWLGMRFVVPEIEDGGSIVISSSVAGVMGTAGFSAYTASKHALIGIMRATAKECAQNKVRVNTVNPSPVESRMMESIEKGYSPDKSEEAHENFEKMIPLGRYAEPEEVADLMLFLASDESKFITGSVYMIDGGMTA